MAWRRAGEPRSLLERPLTSVQITRAGGAPPGGVDPDRAGRITGRRAGGGGQRAVVGGLLVAAAAVIVFAAALSATGGHRVAYIVAARSLPAGSVIGPGDTTTARLELGGATAAGAFRQQAPLIGRSVAVDVPAGQLIQSSMLTGSGAARLRPVSIPVDTDSLAPLAAGEEVDVLSVASSAGGSQAPPTVSVVLRGATLLSVGRPGSGLFSSGSGATVVVTLGVSDLGQAEQVMEAAHTATVELLRAEPSDGTGLGDGSGASGG